MHVYLKDHFIFLTASFVVGLVLSFIYDMFRLIRIVRTRRYISKHPPSQVLSSLRLISFYEDQRKKTFNKKSELLFIFVEDILYSVIVCIFTLILVYGFNYGKIRLFSVVGMIFGFYAWRFTFGRLVIYICEYLIYLITVLLFYVLFPFSFLIRKIKKVIYKFTNLLYNKLVRVFTNNKHDDELPEKFRKISFNSIYMVKR